MPRSSVCSNNGWPLLCAAHILFLERTPTLSKLNDMKIGVSVADMIRADEEAEVDAIKGYGIPEGLSPWSQ